MTIAERDAIGGDEWWERVVVGDLRRTRARLVERVERIDRALANLLRTRAEKGRD